MLSVTRSTQAILILSIRYSTLFSHHNILATVHNMAAEVYPINASIWEINSDCWLIAGKLLLSRQCLPSSNQPSWSDGNGRFYVLSEVSRPQSECQPLSEASELRKVYDAGGVSAVWRAGEAFIKVKEVTMPNATREHVTLEYLHRKGPLGFSIPIVYYHAEFNGRYYIVLGRLPGQTLSEAWPNMDEPTKKHHVRRIASAVSLISASSWRHGRAIVLAASTLIIYQTSFSLSSKGRRIAIPRIFLAIVWS